MSNQQLGMIVPNSREDFDRYWKALGVTFWHLFCEELIAERLKRPAKIVCELKGASEHE